MSKMEFNKDQYLLPSKIHSYSLISRNSTVHEGTYRNLLFTLLFVF